MEGKKGRMPRCLVRQCCLFFSCCVRPVKILGFSFTTNEVFLLTVSLHTDHLLFQDLSHTQCLTVRRGGLFFLAPPVNGLRNLWSHWHCSRAKEKVTAEAKKKKQIGQSAFHGKKQLSLHLSITTSLSHKWMQLHP